MSFDIGDYKEVPERIAEFSAKYPEGSLQGDGYFVRDVEEKIIGYHYVARAYRTAEDARPGVGTAYEPIPGKTPYTKDSEVMNAETSAWGRAIVALGFSTKKIASANEVRARQGSDGVAGSPTAAATAPAQRPPDTASPPAEPAQAPAPSDNYTIPEAAQKADRGPTPDDGGDPGEVAVHFGKNAGVKLGSMTKNQLKYYAENELRPTATPQDRRLKGAAQTLLGLATVPAADGLAGMDSIPFQRTIA